MARAHVQRLPAPLKLNFAVTYWCQYRCQTCNVWQKRPTDELTTDEMLRFIARNNDVSWIDVTGGEIFLRKDIGEILDAMVRSWKNLVLLHFPTNGFQTDAIVRTAERLARVSSARIVITVSVDGDGPLNDEIRGIKGGYRQQIETFNALRRIAGLRVLLGMTLSARNVDAVEATFRACQRDAPGLQMHDFHVNVMQLSSHYYANTDTAALLPSRAQAINAVRTYRRLRGDSIWPSAWLESAYLRRLEQFLETDHVPMQCHSLRSSCFIDPWGTVFPCITYTRPLGSLRDTDMRLAPIWHGVETTGVQKEIWDGRCPQCWTACEAYQSILGNVGRPFTGRLPRRGVKPRCPTSTDASSGL